MAAEKEMIATFARTAHELARDLEVYRRTGEGLFGQSSGGLLHNIPEWKERLIVLQNLHAIVRGPQTVASLDWFTETCLFHGDVLPSSKCSNEKITRRMFQTFVWEMNDDS